jgi:hypothetical protein
MRIVKILGLTLATAISATTAHATPLSDNFDAQNGGAPALNYFGLSNFTVTNSGSGGSVDLIGTGTGGSAYDFFPGNGLYIDMCGSTSACGTLATNQIFAAGTYDVSISLGGNARSGIQNGTTVNFGSYSNTIMLDTFQLYTLNFTTTLNSASALSLGDLGLVAANMGNILFSVDIAPSQRTGAVPEPISLALFASGLLGAAAMRRRKFLAA